MTTDRIEIDEVKIDIKEIFRTVNMYKIMIFFLIILFGLASSYIAYYQPNIYQASSTVQIGLVQGAPGNKDIVATATESGSVDVGTEKGIILSRSLSQRVANEVDFSHRYYTTRRFKEIELYKDSPFQVSMNRGYYISFDLYPVDEKMYRLVVADAKDQHKKVWSYDKLLPYGKEIVTEHFHLNIVKTKEPQDAQYRLMVMDPADMGNYVQGGVAVTQMFRSSALFNISYSDNVALRAQEAANALSRAYIAQNIETKTKEATRKQAFIDQQLKRITENLKGSAIKVEEFQKTVNTVDLSSKANLIIQRIAEYEIQLTEISIDEEMLSELYKQVKAGKNIETISIFGVGMAQSSVEGMVTELRSAIMEKRILRQDYTEIYPVVKKLTKTIAQFKKNIVVAIKNLRKSVKDKKVLIEKSILKQQKLLGKLPTDQRVFEQMQRKFAVNEKIYSYLLEKRSETAIIKASTVSKNKIIDEALLPKDPIKPKRKTIVLIGLILGLILGVALAFLREFLNDRIKKEADIKKVTDVPMLGIIPHIKEDSGTIQVFRSPKSYVAESFRNLRTNLQFISGYKDTHTIAVTSTVGGEGKTTTSINLGGIISMAGKKTVILNLDMRKPTLHEKFGLPNVQGMSTLLSGRNSLGDVLQHTEYKDLDIIPSGPVPPNPSELIQGELMKKILDELQEIYDVIIMDTPPVGIVSDAKVLMHLANTSIYVLRADYSKKDYLLSIKELSSFKGIHGLSILLNDVKESQGGYGYYEEDEK